ncbi:hypothetical protein [Streptomyces sp. NPDC005438]|uniref:hypothetical protein n=1 Tax=Streptomyces sp. NPDC005438 TaxID=3156880 RepID=UPI0033BC65FC
MRGLDGEAAIVTGGTQGVSQEVDDLSLGEGAKTALADMPQVLARVIEFPTVGGCGWHAPVGGMDTARVMGVARTNRGASGAAHRGSRGDVVGPVRAGKAHGERFPYEVLGRSRESTDRYCGNGGPHAHRWLVDRVEDPFTFFQHGDVGFVLGRI